jgi:UDP-glucose 4-epimerase
VGSFSEDSICKPNHPYSISHKSAEDYVLWYRSDFDLNTKIVRLSNSFGYPAFPTANRWTLFINDICKQIAEKNQFEIRSNVLQHRDFISLTEVCSAVNKLLKYQPISLPDSIFNLSKGASKSLLDLGKLTKEIAENLLETEVNMIYDESKNQITEEVYISNEKLKSINWSTSDSEVKEEITKTIEYFKNHSLK